MHFVYLSLPESRLRGGDRTMRNCVLAVVVLVLYPWSALGEVEDAGVADEFSLENYIVELPKKLQDAAFDQYVDIQLMAHAVDALDAELLTDVGLQLAEGERILLRPHQGV